MVTGDHLDQIVKGLVEIIGILYLYIYMSVCVGYICSYSNFQNSNQNRIENTEMCVVIGIPFQMNEC